MYLQWIGYTSQILPWNELDLRLQAALAWSAEGKTVVLILKEAVKRHILNVCIPLSFSAVSPKCVHNGKEFSEGEVYRMDPCWLCQCRGGISFCSKAECAELDCENFYIPEGECCPVCIGTHTHTHTYCLFAIIYGDVEACATLNFGQHCQATGEIESRCAVGRGDLKIHFPSSDTPRHAKGSFPTEEPLIN